MGIGLSAPLGASICGQFKGSEDWVCNKFQLGEKGERRRQGAIVETLFIETSTFQGREIENQSGCVNQYE